MKFTMSKSSLLLLFLILITSCTETTTKTRNPVFISIDKIQSQLVSLVKADNINLNGKEITVYDTHKKTTSELEISITNGQNIPTGEEERKALGKTVAAAVKSNLKDSNEFEKYTVLFITKVESGGVTKHHWVGNVFTSKEL